MQSRLNEGELPLWDDRENLGFPLAANPTGALFYPLKLPFFLTAVWPKSYDFLFAWYIVIHFPIAGAGLYALLRRLRLSRAASAFSATAYMLGGPILAQMNNPIFLIGAAWLPWALYHGVGVLRERRTFSGIALALVLAAMVLGGDVQSAYLAGLMLFLLWVFDYRSGLYSESSGPAVSKNRQTAANRSAVFWLAISFKNSRLGRLILSGLLAGALSAAALIPAMEMDRFSDRALRCAPISLWEIPKFLSPKKPLADDPTALYLSYFQEGQSVSKIVSDGIFCRNLKELEGLHEANIYQYSVHPLRLIELFWPSIGGSCGVDCNWWIEILTSSESQWFSTFYFGAIPLLLALSALTFRRTRSRSGSETFSEESLRRWASYLAVLAILASLGGYGLVWFFRFLGSAAVGQSAHFVEPGDPVGGVCWFMNLLLPKFATFRFPAKLTVSATLFLCILAAFGFDRLRQSGRFARLAAGYLTVSFAFLVIFLLTRDSFLALLAREKSSSIFCETFGPFNPDRTAWAIIGALTRGSAVVAIFWAMTLCVGPVRSGESSDERRHCPRRFGVRTMSGATFGFLALLLLGADLYFANGWTVLTVPVEQLHRDSLVRQRIETDYGATLSRLGLDRSVMPPVRLYIDPSALSRIPSRFTHDVFPNRLQELSGWFQAALNPKITCPNTINELGVGATAKAGDYYAEYVSLQSADAPTRAAIASLQGVDYLLDASVGSMPFDGAVLFGDSKTVGGDWPEIIRVLKNENRPARLRAVRGQRSVMTDRDPIRTNAESIRYAAYASNRFTFDVRLKEPAEIIVSDQFWPGWRAWAEPLGTSGKAMPLEIRRTARVLRQVQLPAGDWRVTMSYVPTSFYVGMAVSVLTGLLTLLFCLVPFFRNPMRIEKSSDRSV